MRKRVRLVKTCPHCGDGYDAFKSMEVRGRYCSAECLTAARAARRRVSASSIPLRVVDLLRPAPLDVAAGVRVEGPQPAGSDEATG